MAIKKHGKTDFLSGIRPESLDSIANEIETKKETAKEVVPEENNNSNNLSSNSPITDNKEKENEIVEEKIENTSNELASDRPTPRRKKSIENWGRPRKLLIEGEKEKSLTVQLPDSLIKVMRKVAKKEGKSMKEIIGGACLEKYSELLKK